MGNASTIYIHSAQGGFYRISKQASELYIEEYSKRFSLNYTILRFGTVYGERANKFNTVKNFIDSAKKYKKIIRNTQGEEVRSYINVKDVTKIVYLLTQKKYENDYFNIFGNKKTIVKNLANDHRTYSI